MSIIKNIGNLNKKIMGTFKTMTKVNNDLAEIAGSVLWHLGTHRDPRSMNTFYTGLPKNYQAGFKRWVVTVSMLAVAERILEPKVSDLPFSMKENLFVVKKDTVELTSLIAAYCEAHEADVGFGRFMDIDPDRSKDPFNVLQLDKVLKSLITRANKEGSEVSLEVRTILAETVAEFERKAKRWIDEAVAVGQMHQNVAAARHNVKIKERPAILQ